MSPNTFAVPASTAVAAALRRFWIGAGLQIREARRDRRWTVAELARRAGMSRSMTYLAEAGAPTSIEAVTRLAAALGLRLDVALADSRRRSDRPARSTAVVHSAMGEVEAAHLRGLGVRVGIDEPYQHYQFAGRADLVAWDVERRALLHIENKTRLPDLQELAGSFNAKRAYLGAVLADRVGIRRWSSETHVIAGLWSAEVLHVIRLRQSMFRSLCPDEASSFEAWWTGAPPSVGTTAALVIFDPLATGRQRSFVDLDGALSVRPRHPGYAGVAARLARAA